MVLLKIISIFALKEGLFDVVKSSIAGAVIGNILLETLMKNKEKTILN